MTGFILEHNNGNVAVESGQILKSFTQVVADNAKNLNESQIYDMIRTLNCHIWFETTTNIIDFENMHMGAINKLCIECTSSSTNEAVIAAISAAKSEYEDILNRNYYRILAAFPCLKFIDELSRANLAARVIKMINTRMVIDIESYLINTKVLMVQHRQDEITHMLEFASYDSSIELKGKKYEYSLSGGMIIPGIKIGTIDGIQCVMVHPGRPIAPFPLIMSKATEFRLQVGAVVSAANLNELRDKIRTIFNIESTSVLTMHILSGSGAHGDNIDFDECRFTFTAPLAH
jgi:hypothetical protein